VPSRCFVTSSKILSARPGILKIYGCCHITTQDFHFVLIISKEFWKVVFCGERWDGRSLRCGCINDCYSKGRKTKPVFILNMVNLRRLWCCLTYSPIKRFHINIWGTLHVVGPVNGRVFLVLPLRRKVMAAYSCRRHDMSLHPVGMQCW
jgi:hypothetical protein